MASFWDSAAPDLVYGALLDYMGREAQGREDDLNRYRDYRDGRPELMEKYFTCIVRLIHIF